MDNMDHMHAVSHYMAHGYCFLWQPGLVWLHVVSDIVIGISYYSLPVALFYFAYKRRDLPFYSMFLLFGLFIFSCGTTHFYSAYTVFTPTYWAEGVVKAITAVASAVSAILFIPMLPKAIAMPSLTTSLEQNRELNAQLKQRITELNARTKEVESANLELQLSEDRFRASERQFRELLEHVHLVAVIFDQQGTVTFCNDFLLQLTNWRRDEVIGSNWFDRFLPPEVRDEMKPQFLEGIRLGTVESHSENPIVTKEGGQRHMVWDITLLHNVDDTIAGIACIGTDVTEQRNLEEQLRQSQKMEAIGQLAGGIAHDFNNILTVIGGYITMLLMEVPAGDRKKEKLEQVLAATEKAANLTRSLLTFSRKQVIDVHLVNLNDLVHNVRRFLVRVIGEDIRLSTSTKEDPLMVEVDSGQIEQVFINLAANARDAMPKGGTLFIETDFQQLDEIFVREHGYGTPGPYALISVTDTGTGIDEQTLEKIFDPFFTTKEVGKGTGLGLSIVYGIVKQHNGYINVYSEPGHGTIFRIYLPACLGVGAPCQEVISAAPPPGGTETILVAEDDAAVSRLIESILTQYGYQVIHAADGQEAIAQFQEHSSVIGLVIMDMIMPGKSGMDAYDEIKKIQPQARVLFSSGYTADFLVNRGNIKDEAEVMMKPVRPLELLKKVRSMLDG